jgi:hypothetical protein
MVAKDAGNGREAETRNLCNAASGDFGNGLSFEEFDGGIGEMFAGFVGRNTLFSWLVAHGHTCEIC